MQMWEEVKCVPITGWHMVSRGDIDIPLRMYPKKEKQQKKEGGGREGKRIEKNINNYHYLIRME